MFEFSKINEYLYIGTTPEAEDYIRLKEEGIDLVINMRFWMNPHPKEPLDGLNFLWLRSFDNPILKIPMNNLIRGVHESQKIIRNGGKILSHCARGRHRSVAMGAAILISQGYSIDESIALIKNGRPIVDPEIFYIKERIVRFNELWSMGKV